MKMISEIDKDLYVCQLEASEVADRMADSKHDAGNAEYLAHIFSVCFKNQMMAFGICLRDQLVGLIGLQVNDQHIAKMHYELIPDHRGKGIMTKSCKSVLDYAFRELDLAEIQIRPDIDNLKSLAIPERLGFRCGGCHEYQTPRGKAQLVFYSLSRDDWDNGNRSGHNNTHEPIVANCAEGLA